MISAIASFLVSSWDNLSGFVQWTIEKLAGSGLVDAIYRGYRPLVDYLSGLPSSVISSIANVLGL